MAVPAHLGTSSVHCPRMCPGCFNVRLTPLHQTDNMEAGLSPGFCYYSVAQSFRPKPCRSPPGPEQGSEKIFAALMLRLQRRRTP